MQTESNRVIALRFAQEGWGTNPDWETVWDELMATDVVYHFNSQVEPIVGLDANKAFNASLFVGFPNIQHTIEDVITEGDKVVYRSTIEGVQTGEFLGISPTGKTAKVNDFTLLRFINGRIVEWWYDCNLLAVMQQLGVYQTS
ncbi:MAG: ester cyclase [Cyanobacteria bacterium J06636_16]